MIKKIKKILSSEKEVIFAYLFGSYVTRTNFPGSDIDIGIYLKPGSTKFYLDKEKGVTTKLNCELHTDKVDLIILNVASLLLQYKIVSKGKIIFSSNEEERIRFEIKVLENYFEMKQFYDEAESITMKMIEQGI